MKMTMFCVFLLLSLEACHRDLSCSEDYIGKFKLNLNYITDSSKNAFVLSRRWDTVILISEGNGTYHFESEDPILKASEGVWFVESVDIESTCIGYIHQSNMKNPVPSAPFVLTFYYKDKLELQFLKTP